MEVYAAISAIRNLVKGDKLNHIGGGEVEVVAEVPLVEARENGGLLVKPVRGRVTRRIPLTDLTSSLVSGSVTLISPHAERVAKKAAASAVPYSSRTRRRFAMIVHQIVAQSEGLEKS